MRYNLFIILILSIISCRQSSKEKQLESIDKPKKTISKSKTINIEAAKWKIEFDTINIFPKDTLIKNFNLKFIQISENDYYTYKKKEIKTDFVQDNVDDYLIKKDSCYYLTLKTNEKDTLCNLDDGEYHETYTLSGFSKKSNTLIFDWENWEEAHSILINLNENKHWILNPEYRTSPNNSKLITFINYIDYPIYEGNGLSIYELDEVSVNHIYSISNQKYGVFDINWIGLDETLIHLRRIDYENYLAKESYYFLMKVLEE